MTPEAQRIAIAEACGWTFYKESLDITTWVKLPDYLNDLNAMHEAEEVLRSNQFWYADYWGTLFFVVTGHKWTGENLGYFGFTIIHATARQRAEAFLRTIGKWEE